MYNGILLLNGYTHIRSIGGYTKCQQLFTEGTLMENKKFMGTQEASNYLGVSLDQFRRLMKMGFLKGYQLKPRTPHLFTKEELDGYVRENGSKTG